MKKQRNIEKFILRRIMQTKYEKYLEAQMQNPEFRANFLIAKQNAEIQVMLEEIREGLSINYDKSNILSGLDRIENLILQTAI